MRHPKMGLNIFLAVLLSMSLIPAAAHAAPRGYYGTVGSTDFQQRDKNQDGVLSQDEWSSQETSRYQSLDRNRDARVSYNEFYNFPSSERGHSYQNNGQRQSFSARQRVQNNNGWGNGHGNGNGRGQNRFENKDTNHDGVLSRNEWPANRVEYYAALDANHDGNLTSAEFTNRQQVSSSLLRGLDTNRDNRVSRGEWTSDSAEFNRIDTNTDNFLTVGELSAAATASASATTDAVDGNSLEQIFMKLFQGQ